jgi:hypothetical protein
MPRKDHDADRKGVAGQVAARLFGAEKRRMRGRARSAHRQLTRRRCLNEANAVSAVSWATWPRIRASQGSRCAAPTAEAKRRGLPGHTFAAQTVASHNKHKRHPTQGANFNPATRNNPSGTLRTPLSFAL